MRVTRILDLMIILLLATVLLMPRAGVTVKPALQVDPERRDRVAELQSQLMARPGAMDPALELANIYLDGHRPDWALATVDGVLKDHPDDYRLYHLRAIAYADRFEGAPAYDAAVRAADLCDRTPTPAGGAVCGDAARSRLALLKTTLASVAMVDMRKQPYLAKERIMQSLHPAFLPRKRAAAAPKVTPAPKPKVAPAPAPSPAAP